MTVEPVVVSPDIASKKASVKFMSRPENISGSAPTTVAQTQTPVVRRKPWRMLRWSRAPLVVSSSAMPKKTLTPEETENTFQSGLPWAPSTERRHDHQQAERGDEPADDVDDGDEREVLMRARRPPQLDLDRRPSPAPVVGRVAAAPSPPAAPALRASVLLDHRPERPAGEDVDVEVRDLLVRVARRCWRGCDSRPRPRPAARAVSPTAAKKPPISAGRRLAG